MTPEVEKKRRELFSKWCDEKHLVRQSTRRMLWPAFNAALDAVEIELPPGFTHHDGSDVTRCVMDADDVVAAITATGLGLKVKP